MAVIVKGLTSERLTHHGPHFRYDNVPMELRPLQQPHPGFWYGTLSTDNAIYAARRGMNIVSIGGLDSVKRVVAAYREHHHESAGSPLNVNPHLARPIAGAIRHIYVADTDREAEQVARESYRAFFANLQKLWRDYNTSVLAFPSEYEMFHGVGASISGSVASVRDQVARFCEESGCDYLVLAFAWGNLTACTDAPLIRSFREPDHAGFRPAPGRRIARSRRRRGTIPFSWRWRCAVPLDTMVMLKGKETMR